MAEVTLTAVVDESHMIHLELPPEFVGEVDVVIKERYPVGSNAALWQAVDSAPQAADPTIWARAREELMLSREED